MLKKESAFLKIGEISKKTNISVSALRYYEQFGLLMPAYKSEANYRLYKNSDVSLALFIKKSQNLGFAHEEIKDILEVRKNGKSPCPRVRELANKKVEDLRNKIKELKKIEADLKKYITCCKKEDDSNPEDGNVCKMIDRVSV